MIKKIFVLLSCFPTTLRRFSHSLFFILVNKDQAFYFREADFKDLRSFFSFQTQLAIEISENRSTFSSGNMALRYMENDD